MDTRAVINKFPFDMEIPNEPYLDNFSQGITHPAFYTGSRWLKFQIQNDNGLIKELVVSGETKDEIESKIAYNDEGHSFHIIDAKQNPWEAAYLTHEYAHDPVPNYEENLGTTDADGNAEVWDYDWGHVLNQIYYNNELRYVNGEYIKPPFRLHQHTQEAFLKSLADHIEMAEREISRQGIYTQAEMANLEEYARSLSTISTKYTGIHHWKIPFPALPLIKP